MKTPLMRIVQKNGKRIIPQEQAAPAGHEPVALAMPRPSGRTRRVLGGALLGAAVSGCLLLFSACGQRGKTGGDIWAEVDGQPIVADQVNRIYDSRKKAGSSAADGEEVMSFKLNILNELINNQILVAHALQSGITVSEAEVDNKIAQLESPYSQAEFEQKLKDSGMDRADLRREIKTQLLIDKLIARDIDAKVTVSNSEMESYYNQNKTSFNVPETEYELAQIEVTPVPTPGITNLKDDDAKNAQSAQQKIQALYAQLQRGADFTTLARNYSEDPRTAPNGGDMGFVPISTLNSSPDLKRVVLSLKPGQVSGIIRTPGGYHIVKLISIVPAGQREFSDPQVQATIRRTLTNEKDQLLKNAFIEVLRDRAKVRNFLAERVLKQNGEPSQ